MPGMALRQILFPRFATFAVSPDRAVIRRTHDIGRFGITFSPRRPFIGLPECYAPARSIRRDRLIHRSQPNVSLYSGRMRRLYVIAADANDADASDAIPLPIGPHRHAACATRRAGDAAHAAILSVPPCQCHARTRAL